MVSPNNDQELARRLDGLENRVFSLRAETGDGERRIHRSDLATLNAVIFPCPASFFSCPVENVNTLYLNNRGG